MPIKDVRTHPHLVDPNKAEGLRYTYPGKVITDPFERPSRNRSEHANHLLSKLKKLSEEADEQAKKQKVEGVSEGNGIYLSFESEPDFELKFESLEMRRSGIELCAVKSLPDDRKLANVFVPDGKLSLFLNKITAYRDEDTTPRSPNGKSKPKNQNLVESISDIRIAALEALWTDDRALFPDLNTDTSWEVWLRGSGKVDHLSRIRENAEKFSLVVGEEVLKFVDRSVIMVRGTAINLASSIEILGAVAELRAPKTSAALFTEMDAFEQKDWVDDLVSRTELPDENVPYVCLLDTGLNNKHPLIEPLAADDDLHTCKLAWGLDDREGHGTPVAGLALYGDLGHVLEHDQPVRISHRLESVKMFNRTDQHEPEVYGAVTQESVFRVESVAVRDRVFCSAITATDNRDRGRPSSWSAAIDSLASGYIDDQRRLLVISAGNTDLASRGNYPDSNLADSIHDPGQAWNALTVGGYTEKALIDQAKYPGWKPLAEPGDLSPASCTSVIWQKKWPVKPDIVMEAGNMAKHAEFSDPDFIDDSLQLVSTRHNFAINKLLTSFGDTSAAAPLCARLAAMLWAKYPDFTPETIRAMIVHSADWTPAMLKRFALANHKTDYTGLVRCFGFGVPDVQRLMSSADNSLTLIAQDEIEPFYKDEDGGSIKTRDLKLHALPWPLEVLKSLDNTEVKLKVTLSYFVEPSPGARGWADKYGYPSHGLRFHVKRAPESRDAFTKRINKLMREDGYDTSQHLKETGKWTFGHANRSLLTAGSIHSDTWTGPAVELAERGHIAVYPTIGWWAKRPHLKGYEKAARYSLVVTIDAPETDVDIYTPVANAINIPVVIET